MTARQLESSEWFAVARRRLAERLDEILAELEGMKRELEKRDEKGKDTSTGAREF